VSAAPAAGGAPAGLFRRLAAIFYDLLLLVSVLMLATAVMLFLTHGRAITPADTGLGGAYLYRAALLVVIVLYFGLSWRRGGQTLGMQAWKIRVERANGAAMRWKDVLLRLAAALLSWLPLGLGYLWILVDRRRLAWHDRLSRTRMVRTR
jgi:uncharacterized RDD family membrane protein YckC